MRVRARRSGRRAGWRGIGCTAGLLLAVGLATPAQGAQQAGSLSLQVLSTRADLVSGGDALAEVVLPTKADAGSVRVDVDGRDVTRAFAMRPNGRFEGLLVGLKDGPNVVTARDGSGGARITVTNHPIGGPVFSGPQLQPWTCQAGATDAKCDMPTTYVYEYKDTQNGSLTPYDPANPPPSSNVAMTTTDNGHSVPYIIRIETGYQDRDQYQVAVLFTPGAAWAPWAPQPQWDGKLEIPGGSSCGVNHATNAPPSVLDDTALSRGMMVGAPTLDNNGENCNVVVQAEAVEMMKEHIVDDYGQIRYTIGSGCSGGSIYQQQVANAYPGLLDGIVPECSFPDTWSTLMDAADCGLLLAYWNTPGALADGWAEAQQAAVTGDQTTSVCRSWTTAYGFDQLENPSQTGSHVASTPCGVPAAQPGKPDTEYDAKTNPGGVRCDLQDYMADVLGVTPQAAWDTQEKAVGHGFANRPYDNVGVQYGLQALRSGLITPQQFADLNAGIGGVDLDDNPTAARTVADAGGLANVYRSGAVDEANGLGAIPIVDLRGHDVAEIHADFRSYVMRQRLDQANGGHANQVIWTGPVLFYGYTGSQSGRNMTQDGFLLMDRWLTNISNDHSSRSQAEKVVADKPADAVDTCFDASGDPLPAASCPVLYPYDADPRVAAGASLRDDVIKCQLEALTPSAYPGITFTAAQWSELQHAFPNGVCAWNKPGVNQQPAVSWQTYAGGPGGRPLGSRPASTPLGAGASAAAVSIPDTAAGNVDGLRLTGLVAGALATLVCVRRRRWRGRRCGTALTDAAHPPASRKA